MYKIYKNKLFYYSLLIILVSIFLVYIVSYNKTKVNSDNNDIMTGIINKEIAGYDNIKMTLKSIYKLNGKESVDCTYDKSKEELFKLSGSELRNMYKKEGYKFQNVVENEIIYTKTLEKHKYEANKYVIGIQYNKKDKGKDGIVTIYKTDGEGKFISILKVDDEGGIVDIDDKNIDDDIDDLPQLPRINDIPESDIEYLEKGDAKYQFDSFGEAIDGLEGLFLS